MTSGDGDLSDGGDAQGQPIGLANLAIDEHRLRRLFRTLAVSAALLTLAMLLAAMGTIVWTFLHEFRTLAVDAQVELVAAQRAALPAPAAASAAATAASAPALVSAPARLVVSLGGFTTAIAALVTAFVVAATVLAIALVRASFTLAARGDEPPKSDPASGDDSPVTLPTAEFVKAFGESLQTALKGVSGTPR